MSNPDRQNAIAGMTNMSLGSDGTALQLLQRLEHSMNPGTMNPFTPGMPTTWAEMFNELKRFETAVQASAQVADWMGGKRNQWIAFCNNVDNQHPAGFATALLALDISIKGSEQAGTWMASDRSPWVAACRQAGAKDFDWAAPNFVCSGLDGCEVLLEQIVSSIHPAQHMSGQFKAGDYKTYGALFDALKQFEAMIKASSQEPAWMSGKRSAWLAFCNNTANHTPTGFASAVLALDLSVPAHNNTQMWGQIRPQWVQRCRNAGAVTVC